MENQASSKNVILSHGLIYGFILILASVMVYALNMLYDPKGGLIYLVVMILATLVIPIMGIARFKKINLNFLSWVEAVKIGIGIVVLGTLLNTGYSFVFSEFVEPEYLDNILQIQREAFEADERLTKEQVDQQIEMIKKFQGTPIGAAIGLLFYTFVGFVISAIAGAVMKRSEEDGY